MSRETGRWLWSSVFLAALLVPGSASAQAPCDIFAGPPQRDGTDGGAVFGSGGRGPSCGTSAGIKVLLKKDRRLWFDQKLAEKSGSGTNFDVTVRFTCTGRQGGKVYVRAEGRGRKKESGRANVQFCF